MTQFATRFSNAFRKFVMFVDRRLVWVLENMGPCAIVVSLLGVALSLWGLALGMNWGAAQLGPLSSYLAAAATLTAVSVALQQSAQARKIANESVLAAKLRAEIDRDFDHRRETTNQIVKMWGEISDIEPLLVLYMNVEDPDSDVEPYMKFITALHRARSAIFAARAISLNAEILRALEKLDTRLGDFDSVATLRGTKDDAWSDSVLDRWVEVTDLRDTFAKLLREHLPLLESAEEENKRLQALKQKTPALREWMQVVLTSHLREGFVAPATAAEMDLLRDAARVASKRAAAKLAASKRAATDDLP